jgi:uncharacterized protein
MAADRAVCVPSHRGSFLPAEIRVDRPLLGIGYRADIHDWTVDHLERFGTLEVTVDHVLWGGQRFREWLSELIGRVPLYAHGIGLSIGTDALLDYAYLEGVAEAVAFMGSPWYSEHLAFTKAPGYDLANLLPVPKTRDVARQVIAKVRQVQAAVPVPFMLENITYMFEWPDSAMSDAEFFKRICGETGADVLLDVENLYINSKNHSFDPHAFIDALPAGSVRCMHMAGGCKLRGMLTDTHDHRLRAATLDLFEAALSRHRPEVVILERDGRLDAGDEILADLDDIAARLAKATSRDAQPATARSSD